MANPCSCVASQIVIPPAVVSCDDCLQIASAVIACTDSVGPCNKTGTLDLAALNTVTACQDNAGAQCAVSYTVLSFDEVALDSATIDAAGLLSFETSILAIPDDFVEVRYRVDCDCGDVLSGQGVIRICIKDLCNAVVCSSSQACDPCDGVCKAQVDADMEVDFISTPVVITADAVDDALGAGIPTAAPYAVDVSTNDTTCNGGLATTWTLKVGSEVNCTVVDNGAGSFDVTPTIDGVFSFQYDLSCAAVILDTATVSGTAATASPCVDICTCEAGSCTGTETLQYGGFATSGVQQQLDGVGVPIIAYSVDVLFSGVTDPASNPSNQVTVDWGDATPTEIAVYGTDDLSHTYASSGIKTITVTNTSTDGILSTTVIPVTFDGAGLITSAIDSSPNLITAISGVAFGSGVFTAAIADTYAGCPVSSDIAFIAGVGDPMDVKTALINAISETVTNDTLPNEATWNSDHSGWTLDALIPAVISIEDSNSPGPVILTITTSMKSRCL